MNPILLLQIKAFANFFFPVRLLALYRLVLRYVIESVLSQSKRRTNFSMLIFKNHETTLSDAQSTHVQYLTLPLVLPFLFP